jgi:hypothetical protein
MKKRWDEMSQTRRTAAIEKMHTELTEQLASLMTDINELFLRTGFPFKVTINFTFSPKEGDTDDAELRNHH